MVAMHDVAGRLLRKKQTVGTDRHGHRRTRHGGESARRDTICHNEPDQLFLWAVTLGMPRVASRAAIPKKTGSWREALVRRLEAPCSSAGDRCCPCPHAFKFSQNYPLKSTKTLFFSVWLLRVVPLLRVFCGKAQRGHVLVFFATTARIQC